MSTLINTEGMKRNIIDIIIRKEYEKAIMACEEYIKAFDRLTEVPVGEKQRHYWFATYNMALCYKKLENIDKSLELALTSIKYANEHDDNYISSLWLIGVCYMETKQKYESIKTFRLCAKLYKKLKQHTYRMCCIFNAAKSLEDHSSMLRIIRIYEKNCFRLHKHYDLDEDELLYEMYVDLMRVYSKKGLLGKAYSLLLHVRSINIKFKLSNVLMDLRENAIT